MTKILLRKQLAEIFRTYLYDAKKNKARSKGTVIAYFVLFALLMVGLLGGMFTFLAFTLRSTIVSGYGWFYYLIFALAAVCIGAFGSVFNTFSGLYLSRDNDLLLSMPIPVHSIMASRLLTVFLMGLMYSRRGAVCDPHCRIRARALVSARLRRGPSLAQAQKQELYDGHFRAALHCDLLFCLLQGGQLYRRDRGEYSALRRGSARLSASRFRHWPGV